MSRRRFVRDTRGRFASTNSLSSRSRRSRKRNAATAGALALGVLYAVDGKGSYRAAGAVLAGAAGAYGSTQFRTRRR